MGADKRRFTDGESRMEEDRKWEIRDGMRGNIFLLHFFNVLNFRKI